MGAVQLPDELQDAVDRQVAAGRARSVAAFLEEAVRRLIEEARSEEDELTEVVRAGIVDIEEGRFTLVSDTPENRERLHECRMARLRASLAADE